MKSTLFSILLLTIFCSGCKKNSTPGSNPAPARTPDIYVVGKEYDAPTNHLYAKYWKNGVGTDLTDGAYPASATAIVVVNDDIYISGYETNSLNKTVAKYWKNGIQYLLTDGSNSAEADNIAVSGSDIYVVGFEYNTLGIPIAKYWKNGTPYSLTDGTNWSGALSISVDGNDVYISGFGTTFYGISVAKYWKNGISYSLSDGTKSTVASAILAKNSNLYVASTETNSLSFQKLIFWNNSMPNIISSDTIHRVFLGNNIIQNGTDIYFAGSVNNGQSGNFVAYYWKNNVPFALSNGTRQTQATSISVFGNDVYVAGWGDNGTDNLPKYWKNGTETILSVKRGYAYGVFVK